MGKKHKRMQLERLQYAEWTEEVKSKLRLVAYSTSRAGNICGYYQYIDSDVPSVYHWMNDEEQKAFLKHRSVPYVENIQEFSKIFLPKDNIKSKEEVQAEMKFGDVITAEKFRKLVEPRCIIDDDGCGCLHNGIEETDLDVFEYFEFIDKFPYVCWYNK